MNNVENRKNFFHLHLISDSTGETLISAGRAAAAQFRGSNAIEHVYPLIRSKKQIKALQTQVNQLGRTRPVPARSTSMVANAEVAGALRGKPGRKVLFTAERLKTQRARLGFTQEQMAKLLGVSSLSIWKWESGGAVPRASRVPKILQLLALGKREALVLLTAEAT